MNINDLKALMNKLHVPANFYSLCGGLPNEAYCINKTDVGWEVYYSERGNKTGLKFFSQEGLACEYFLDYISGDFTFKEIINKYS